MSIKVKARIEFNKIIEKLHKTAKDFADKKSGNKIILENLAFDDRNGEFLGGGEHCVMMKQKEGEVNEKSKGLFLDVAKEYIHYFLGEEEASYIELDDLQPIYEGETSTDTSDATREREQKEKEQKEKEQREKNAVIGGMGAMPSMKESKDIINPKDSKILNMLFEEDERNPSAPPPVEDNEKSETEDKNNDGKCIGFGFMYDMDVNGQKDKAQSFIQKKAKGLFGGILADLRNIKIKIGGEPVNLGHIFDPQKWKELIGKKDIDINQVPDAIVKAFKSDFRNNDINSSSVKVWQKDELITQLNRAKKITPEIKAKISSADYSMQIAVNQKDPNYPKYNTKSIANTVSKALGTTYNVYDWNKVKDKDVIKIDDIEGLYKKKSNYDKPNSRYVQKKDTDDTKKKPEEKKDKPLNEREGEEGANSEFDDFGDEDTALEQVGKENDTKDDNKKESVEDILKSEKYIQTIEQYASQQNEKHLKSLGDEVITKYCTIEDCIKQLKDSDIDNVEFINKLKKMNERVLMTTITKNPGKSIKESIQILNSILKKYDMGSYLISESEENESLETEKVTLNPFQNEKEDSKFHIELNGMAKADVAIGNIEDKMKKNIALAYKNIFYSVQNDISSIGEGDLDFQVFNTESQITEQKENKQNRNIGDVLFEVKGIDNSNVDKEEIRVLTFTLKGGVEGIHEYNEEQENSDSEETNESRKQKKSQNNTNDDQQQEEKLEPQKYNPLANMGPRLQVQAYAVVSETKFVIDYLKNHNIIQKDEQVTGKNNTDKFKYCALILKKKSLMDKNGNGALLWGGINHEELNDKACQRLLDDIFGKDNRIPVIECKNQNQSNMNTEPNELIAGNLGFHNAKRVALYKKIYGKTPIPELEAWVRPFNLEDIKKPRPEPHPEPEPTNGGSGNTYITLIQNITNQVGIQNNVINNVTFIDIGGGSGGFPIVPVNINVKMKFIFIMPDPIIIMIKIKGKPEEPEPEPDPTPKDPDPKQNDDKKSGNREDWYIIPHKNLADMGNRGHQTSTDSHGVTTTKTSNAEYKPDDRVY